MYLVVKMFRYQILIIYIFFFCSSTKLYVLSLIFPFLHFSVSYQSISHVFVTHNWFQILSPFFRKIVGCTLRYNGHTSIKSCGWQMCHWDKLCCEALSTSHLFTMLNTCVQNTQWIRRIHSTVSPVWWYFIWWMYQTVKLVLSILELLVFTQQPGKHSVLHL